jgi:hypothetical protein
MGQTIYPLGLGFLAGMVVQWLTKSDAVAEAAKDSESAEAADRPAEVVEAVVEVTS